METTNLTKANETLNKMTANIKLANDLRVEAVQTAITEVIAFGKENSSVFTLGKKGACQAFIQNILKDKAVDTYTKRAIKVAKSVVIDGYKIKKELLSLAQMENLLKFNKAQVNGLMKLEGDEYIEGIKELIDSAKIEKTVRVFSPKKARG